MEFVRNLTNVYVHFVILNKNKLVHNVCICISLYDNIMCLRVLLTSLINKYNFEKDFFIELLNPNYFIQNCVWKKYIYHKPFIILTQKFFKRNIFLNNWSFSRALFLPSLSLFLSPFSLFSSFMLSKPRSEGNLNYACCWLYAVRLPVALHVLLRILRFLTA